MEPLTIKGLHDPWMTCFKPCFKEPALQIPTETSHQTHPVLISSGVGNLSLSRKRGQDFDDSDDYQKHSRRRLSYDDTVNTVSSFRFSVMSPSVSTSVTQVIPESLSTSSKKSTLPASTVLPKPKIIHLPSFLDALRARASASTSIDHVQRLSAQQTPAVPITSSPVNTMGSSTPSLSSLQLPAVLIDLTESSPPTEEVFPLSSNTDLILPSNDCVIESLSFCEEVMPNEPELGHSSDVMPVAKTSTPSQLEDLSTEEQAKVKPSSYSLHSSLPELPNQQVSISDKSVVANDGVCILDLHPSSAFGDNTTENEIIATEVNSQISLPVSCPIVLPPSNESHSSISSIPVSSSGINSSLLSNLPMEIHNDSPNSSDQDLICIDNLAPITEDFLHCEYDDPILSGPEVTVPLHPEPKLTLHSYPQPNPKLTKDKPKTRNVSTNTPPDIIGSLMNSQKQSEERVKISRRKGPQIHYMRLPVARKKKVTKRQLSIIAKKYLNVIRSSTSDVTGILAEMIKQSGLMAEILAQCKVLQQTMIDPLLLRKACNLSNNTLKILIQELKKAGVMVHSFYWVETQFKRIEEDLGSYEAVYWFFS